MWVIVGDRSFAPVAIHGNAGRHDGLRRRFRDASPVDSHLFRWRMPRHLSPDHIWLIWSWEPGVIIPLGVAGVVYVGGLRRLWEASMRGAGVRHLEAVSYVAGWLVIALALVSPLHALGAVLFSAHMTQHELLITLGAPFLVLGRPLIPLLWAVPSEWRLSVGDVTRSEAFSAAWQALTRP